MAQKLCFILSITATGTEMVQVGDWQFTERLTHTKAQDLECS